MGCREKRNETIRDDLIKVSEGESEHGQSGWASRRAPEERSGWRRSRRRSWTPRRRRRARSGRRGTARGRRRGAAGEGRWPPLGDAGMGERALPPLAGEEKLRERDGIFQFPRCRIPGQGCGRWTCGGGGDDEGDAGGRRRRRRGRKKARGCFPTFVFTCLLNYLLLL